MSGEGRRVRWAVNVAAWEPTAGQWAYLLCMLPEVERTACTRYHYGIDRKRALVSRLLQRALGARLSASEGSTSVLPGTIPQTLGTIPIRRTKQGKPYFSAGFQGAPDLPSMMFNVSHEVWIHPKGFAAHSGLQTITSCYHATYE